MAFHPKYRKNHKFYVDYTDLDGNTRVVEYRSNGTVATQRLRQVLFVEQPYANHNGGQLQFGPDGRLYVGMGDGGSGGDPENRAQNLSSRLGKLLTINVDARRPPVAIAGYGLRNPWRFSFDKSGNLYIGDVGQNDWEEIDYTPRSSPGLENYGWDVYEGDAPLRGQEPEQRRASRDAGRGVQPFQRLLGHRRLRVEGPLLLRRLLLGTRVVAAHRRRQGDRRARRSRSTFPTSRRGGSTDAGNLYAVSLSGTIYRVTGLAGAAPDVRAAAAECGVGERLERLVQLRRARSRFAACPRSPRGGG